MAAKEALLRLNQQRAAESGPSVNQMGNPAMNPFQPQQNPGQIHNELTQPAQNMQYKDPNAARNVPEKDPYMRQISGGQQNYNKQINEYDVHPGMNNPSITNQTSANPSTSGHVNPPMKQFMEYIEKERAKTLNNNAPTNSTSSNVNNLPINMTNKQPQIEELKQQVPYQNVPSPDKKMNFVNPQEMTIQPVNTQSKALNSSQPHQVSQPQTEAGNLTHVNIQNANFYSFAGKNAQDHDGDFSNEPSVLNFKTALDSLIKQSNVQFNLDRRSESSPYVSQLQQNKKAYDEGIQTSANARFEYSRGNQLESFRQSPDEYPRSVPFQSWRQIQRESFGRVNEKKPYYYTKKVKDEIDDDFVLHVNKQEYGVKTYDTSNYIANRRPQRGDDSLDELTRKFGFNEREKYPDEFNASVNNDWRVNNKVSSMENNLKRNFYFPDMKRVPAQNTRNILESIKTKNYY